MVNGLQENVNGTCGNGRAASNGTLINGDRKRDDSVENGYLNQDYAEQELTETFPTQLVICENEDAIMADNMNSEKFVTMVYIDTNAENDIHIVHF